MKLETLNESFIRYRTDIIEPHVVQYHLIELIAEEQKFEEFKMDFREL